MNYNTCVIHIKYFWFHILLCSSMRMHNNEKLIFRNKHRINDNNTYYKNISSTWDTCTCCNRILHNSWNVWIWSSLLFIISLNTYIFRRLITFWVIFPPLSDCEVNRIRLLFSLWLRSWNIHLNFIVHLNEA